MHISDYGTEVYIYIYIKIYTFKTMHRKWMDAPSSF